MKTLRSQNLASSWKGFWGKMTEDSSIIPVERIQKCIYVIRGHKVMLDNDLADLYGVETGALVRAVKRNISRFPLDFMFQITQEEHDSFLRCQIGISKKGHGGRRYLPYVFTEQGIAMLSSVLNSKRAIEVNIAIMRTFVKLRAFLTENVALRKKLEEHDEQIKYIFGILEQMLEEPEQPKKQIGYHTEWTD
jgi:hypothetical protein